MRVYKGKIITCDKNNSVFNYLIEDKGLIKFVGDRLPDYAERADIIDLFDKAMCPTFADTHSHFASYAILAGAVILSNAKSIDEIKEILKEADSKIKKNKTIIAFGANAVKVAEHRLIELKELDEVVPDRHIIVITADGHSLIVNTKTLNRLPKSLSAIRGYDKDSGIMRHEAFYKVVDFMPKLLKRKDVIADFQGAIDGLIKKGIGIVHAATGTGFPGDLDVDLIRWIAKGQDSGFQMRVLFQTFDIKKVLKRKLTRLGGCFKTALDGSIGSRDAAVIKPYEGTDNHGILFYSDEELYENFRKAHNAGLQVQTHAIGDAAFDQATRVWKRVLDEFPRTDHRHGIIHASLITEEGVKICRDYGIQILSQPAFIDVSGSIFEPMYQALGDRVYDAEPHRLFLNMGIMMSAGSDAPVTMPDPIEWLFKACNNPNIKNQLTIQEAMRICTYNGYWATFDETMRGSLEQGKYADMLLLSSSPYEVPKEELLNIKVEKTFFMGKEFVPSKRNVFMTIIKGMVSKKLC